jgi:hypothetical protein
MHTGNAVLAELSVRLLERGVMDFKPKPQKSLDGKTVHDAQAIPMVRYDQALEAVYRLTGDPEVGALVEQRRQQKKGTVGD